jgi:Cof subfamily protein (haloacid dehalogenase superfamily)
LLSIIQYNVVPGIIERFRLLAVVPVAGKGCDLKSTINCNQSVNTVEVKVAYSHSFQGANHLNIYHFESYGQQVSSYSTRSGRLAHLIHDFIQCVTSWSFIGTTLNNDHDITDRTISILRTLSSRGVTVSVATGRTTASALKYIKLMDLPQQCVPTVAFNGGYGCLVDLSNHKVNTLCSNPIPETAARLLIKLAEDLGLVLQYYNGETGDVYAVPLNDEHFFLLRRYANLTHNDQVFLSNYEEALSICLSPKILILTSNPDDLIHEAQERLPNGMFHIIKGSPDPYFVEFLCPGINKASCLAEVMSKCQIDLKEVVAFGDGDNDKEMLYECGMGVAMQNAKEMAKEYANIVLEVSS